VFRLLSMASATFNGAPILSKLRSRSGASKPPGPPA